MAKIPSKVEEMDKAADELLKKETGDKKTEDEINKSPEDVTTIEDKSKLETQIITEDKDKEIWEQRYKTLEGKYKAEVPRMAETIRHLEDIVKDLTEKATQKVDKPVETKDEDEAWLEKEYPDFYRTLDKIITKRTGKVDELSKKLEEFGNKTIKTAEQVFYENLEKKVPDWKDINYDPEFKDWLQVEDGYTGMPKNQLLQLAYSNFNSKAVAKFFEDYKATKSINTTSTKKETKETKLDDKVVPSSRSSKSVVDTNSTEVTPELINDYSRRLRELVNKQDYEGASKLEKELDALLAKGK